MLCGTLLWHTYLVTAGGFSVIVVGLNSIDKLPNITNYANCVHLFYAHGVLYLKIR